MNIMKDDMQLLIIYDEHNADHLQLVQFLSRNDRHKAFCYASVESYIARVLMSRNNLTTGSAPILIRGDKIHTGAELFPAIAPYLSGRWKMMVLLRLLPGSFRKSIVNNILIKTQ
jgi:predicted DCC family thiol-disulfide oxidoreductase YuxK